MTAGLATSAPPIRSVLVTISGAVGGLSCAVIGPLIVIVALRSAKTSSCAVPVAGAMLSVSIATFCVCIAVWSVSMTTRDACSLSISASLSTN